MLRGGARVYRYYQQFFEDYMSQITGGKRLAASKAALFAPR